MEESSKKKFYKKPWFYIVIAAAVAAIGIPLWYFQIKVPHDNAVQAYKTAFASYTDAVSSYKTEETAFQTAAKAVAEKNSEFESEISKASQVLQENTQVLVESTIKDLTVAISTAKNDEVTVPELADADTAQTENADISKLSTKDITAAAEAIKTSTGNVNSSTETVKAETEKISTPPDYSSDTKKLQDCSTALQNSAKQLAQITNPTSDFIIQRIGNLPDISGIAAVTEEHDPNNMLNKQGGYTACVYFLSSAIDQSTVYGADVIEKGTQGGGAVEVFATSDEAKARETYLAGFDSAGALNSGSHAVYGTCLIRTSNSLSATQQKALEAEVYNKLIELQ